MQTVLDNEWSISDREWTSKTTGKYNKWTDGSPYNPDNKLVSVGWHNEDKSDYIFFYHKDMNSTPEYHLLMHKRLQDVLDKTTLLIGHNIKSDLIWLKENGFTYDGAVWDTMIWEYLLNKSAKKDLSLKAICKRRGIQQKKDIMENYFAQGYNTHEIPMKELEEYGRGDIESTRQLYVRQAEERALFIEQQSMTEVMKMSCETSQVLTELSRSGVAIDTKALDKVEADYRIEHKELKRKLQAIVGRVMGHTPINLNSPEQLSWVLYGLKVKDKKKWVEVFNIGTETEGPRMGKKKYPRRMNDTDFRLSVASNVELMYKTEAHQCKECTGKGRIYKIKKNGERWKNDSPCHPCESTGLIYTNTKARAGLGIIPRGVEYVSAGGFVTNKTFIADIVKYGGLTGDAKEFVQALDRYNSVKNYLTHFVEGIQRHMHNDIMHMEYNQCVTATGRLSSSFHNIPRGKTFPVKRAVVSKFEGGKILNLDYAQLEFRIAALLSQCSKAIQFILDEKDIHRVSADYYNISRQDAKAETFGPLFGKQNDYTKHFYKTFPGIHEWHLDLESEAVNTKHLKSPTGRWYAFPFATVDKRGKVRGATQIYNYEVQGVASDFVLPTLNHLAKVLHDGGYKSHPIMTVHDSIVLDVHPDEVDTIVNIVKDIMDAMPKILQDMYKIQMNVPLGYEISIGNNWFDQEEVYKTNGVLIC